jgi:hypothetical protein
MLKHPLPAFHSLLNVIFIPAWSRNAAQALDAPHLRCREHPNPTNPNTGCARDLPSETHLCHINSVPRDGEDCDLVQREDETWLSLTAKSPTPPLWPGVLTNLPNLPFQPQTLPHSTVTVRDFRQGKARLGIPAQAGLHLETDSRIPSPTPLAPRVNSLTTPLCRDGPRRRPSDSTRRPCQAQTGRDGLQSLRLTFDWER